MQQLSSPPQGEICFSPQIPRLRLGMTTWNIERESDWADEDPSTQRGWRCITVRKPCTVAALSTQGATLKPSPARGQSPGRRSNRRSYFSGVSATTAAVTYTSGAFQLIAISLLA